MRRPRLLACFLAAPFAACVAPVGPEWSDPPGNYPPTIASAVPPVGSLLGQDSDGGPASLVVQVDLADQNTGDTLYIRWIVDYPPWTPGLSGIALKDSKPGGGSVLRSTEIFSLSCADVSHVISNHRLMLAVSDRPFDDTNTSTPPDQVSDGFLVEAVWPFVLKCQ